MEHNDSFFKPKMWVCLASMAFLIAGMCYTIFVTKLQNLHITMLTCMGFCILLLVLTGCPYKKIEEAILYSGNLIVPTLLILYTIGAVMGSWIASGTVPMIIYWGLKLINPALFHTTA